MQRALEGWLQQHPDVQSVAVGVASTGADGDLWTGDARHDATATVVRADDAYGVLSITKTLVEAMVLREVAAGHIDLDAPMPPLPGVDPAPDGLVFTPRMLLQHTSGLVDYGKAFGYDPTQPVVTPAQLVNLGLHSPLTSPPGQEAHYSRTNYHWLGLLLEHTTGKPFGELVDDLAGEFGLTRTALDPTPKPGWIGYASGGVRSTVGDMAKWGAALFTPGRVLPPELLSSLTTVGKVGAALGTWPACPCSTDAAGVIHYTAIGQVVAHGGIEYYPDAGIVIVVHVAPEATTAGDSTLSIGGIMRDLVLSKGMAAASGH
jgi:CubicO group peptidase (beta-lactamase class C family)